MMERVRLLDQRFQNEIIENETIYTESEAEMYFDSSESPKKKSKSRLEKGKLKSNLLK